MKVIKRGNKHERKTVEVGLFDCKCCGSELELTRGDFVRPRTPGALGTASCAVCQATIDEGKVVWRERPVVTR